jgi:Uncharacterized protein conserved in bacteria
MAKKSKKSVVEQTKAEQNVDELLTKTDKFLDKHLNKVIIGAVIAIVLVLAYLAYRQFYLAPKEEAAVNTIYTAERYFGEQNWDAALHGDSISGSYGFLDVINEYGSTEEGNLAKAYAGMCYFYLGDAENAVKYLKEYKVEEELTGNLVTGMIGNAYADLGNYDEAIKYLRKAAAEAKSESLTPHYLYKAANIYFNEGKLQEALDLYKQIENEYPLSTEGRTIEKDIKRIETLLK